MKDEIKKACEVMQKGGVILYPTDTVWGIGCDATNEEAVKRVFEIKQRADSKAMLVLVDSPVKVDFYVQDVPSVAWDLIEMTTKPLTIIYDGARNLSQSVSDDYGDRFLVELIQNAHDAHEARRADGEIVLAFAPDECDHGCLYVANRGNGFTKPNLEAITNIAQSSKPVNEGIGNKGLGFRSVLQICSWPEIYSVRGAGGSGTFDGYCFRFAREPDIRRFLPPGQDVGLADEIVQRMPFWHLPVYAQDRPGLVGRFARERFATVVRMPLDSPEARCSVEAQRPPGLFLDSCV